MRSILALGLLLIMCASANAAAARHSRPRQVIVRPDQQVIVPPGQDVTAPGARVAPPGWSGEDTRRWLDEKSSPGLNAG
jgi:hypothetical protein